MATISPASQQPVAQHGDGRTNDAQADPFYQSTPRTNSPGLTTIISSTPQVGQSARDFGVSPSSSPNIPPTFPLHSQYRTPETAQHIPMKRLRPPLNRSQIVPAVQQPQPPARQSRPPAPRMKVPACTHTVMMRAYGERTCHNCGKIPSIGWLYACIQDSVQPVYHLSTSESADPLPTVADSGNYFEAQAQIAASIGMSDSIVKQMTAGAYTYDQIETLLAQRRHVVDTIKRTKNPSSASVPPTPTPTHRPINSGSPSKPVIRRMIPPGGQNLNLAALPMAPAGTPYNTPTDSPGQRPRADTVVTAQAETPRKKSKQKEVCTYQVCHNCRPFFQDRLPLSLEPIANNAELASAVWEKRDATEMPVHDAAVVSNLGMRRQLPPVPLRRSEESMDITLHHRDGTGYDSFSQETGSSDWTPTTTTSSEADSDLSEKFDLSPCPGAGVCPVWSATQGCAYDNGFEDGRREINHGYIGRHHQLAHGLGILDLGQRAMPPPASLTSTPNITPSKGSSISLPNPPTTPITDGTVSESCSCSLPDRSSPRSNKSSNSSEGSEVEVEGGVALTEEAVGTGTPDIKTD